MSQTNIGSAMSMVRLFNVVLQCIATLEIAYGHRSLTLTLVVQTDPFTLSAWILSRQHITVPQARGHLTVLLNAICVGCKFISTAVRRAGVAGNDVLGKAGSSNVQGEDQKKLDVVANEVFKNVLRKSGQCAVLVTEEEEDPIFIEEPYRGDYCVVFDPLDGSSNIECGVSIGTIFGIYRVQEGSSGSINDVLRVSFITRG
jgi:fructose-1,6-bisphosphatase I